ncbi:GTPase IMAP family member 8-like isoform 2-T3 [Clarias gariepinus]
MRQGDVAGKDITVVEAPGWQRNKAVRNSIELLKQEIVLSVSRCPPGPHAVLLVLRLNVKSWKSEQNVLEGYLELLTERVWSHTIVLFTFGDALGDTTIEQYIKTEEYLQGLVQKCGNRYHVFNNKKRHDVSQVTELLEKIEKMVAGNEGCHLEMDKKILQDVEERRREEEKRSKERVMKVSKKKEYIRSQKRETDHLLEMRLVLLGYKNAGKSSSGSTILRDDKFRDRKNKCTDVLMGDGEVAGRKITIVEAPGWRRNTPVCKSTEQFKQQMESSMSMYPPGPHAVLLVMCLDLKFRRKQRKVLEGYLSLLGDNVWSHTIVLFTFGDFLGDTTIEHYIEREGEDLQWLVERCANRYHVFNNTKRDDGSQVTQLLEKIEEMVAGNGDCNLEIDFKSKSELNMEDSAVSNTPPVRRPARMVSPIPSSPHTTIPQNKPGKVSDFEAQGYRAEDFQRGPPITQKQISARIAQQLGPITIFTLGSVKKCAKDKNIEEYRFLCLHDGQFRCKLTDIVFEMKGKGEVLYRIVSWDRHVLNGLGQNKPAGPLYSIDCCEGSIRNLHLPHCETQKHLVKLSVVHVSDGNVTIIHQPQITKTHVIIDVQHLSCFGLVKSLLFKVHPIKAQVLLFYQRDLSKLNIHLVPKNVPVEEVICFNVYVFFYSEKVLDYLAQLIDQH